MIEDTIEIRSVKTRSLSIFWSWFVLSILWFASPQICLADEQTPKDPYKAQCGAYVKSLGKFDYTQNTFFINFYFWWVIDNPDFYPEKTAEITNAETYQRLWSTRDILPNNKIRIMARYTAIVNNNWNLRAYPFDRQTFRVSIEDGTADIDKMIFSVFPRDSKVSPDVILEEWKLVRFNLVETKHFYSTNFGDESKPTSVGSRISMFFELKRDGWTTFFVIFMGFFLAAFMCFSSHFVEYKNFSDRNTLSLGAVFSAIGNKYHLDTTLSASVGLSLRDTVGISTFILIFLTILNNIRVTSLENMKRIDEAHKINLINLIGLSTLYILSIGTAVYIAYKS